MIAESPEPFAGHGDAVRGIALTPDGKQIVSCGDDGVVRVCDLDSGASVLTVNVPDRNGGVRAVAVTPGGNLILACDESGTAWSWGIHNRTERHWIGQDAGVYAAAISPGPEDGATRVITSGIGGDVAVWTWAPGRQSLVTQGHQKSWVHSVAISPDGGYAVSGGADQRVRVWNLTRDDRSAHWTFDHNRRVRAVTVTRECGEVVLGDSHGAVCVWRPGSAESSLSTKIYSEGRVSTVAVIPGDGHIVIGTEQGGLYLWDRSRRAQPMKSRHHGPVLAIAVTPDGSRLISGGEDGTIRVWDRARRTQIAGTGFTPPLPGRPRAGLTNDEESAQDLLGFSGDVNTLAALIADRATKPPLAIALLGEWGSGKSSFIRQLAEQIDRLTEVSTQDSTHSVYAGNVRQVRFNAWHYSDDHLWVGMVEHLFGKLAEANPLHDSSAIREERESLRDELHDLCSKQAKLERGLRGSQSGLLRTLFGLSWTERSARKKPWYILGLVLALLGVLGLGASLLWGQVLALVGFVVAASGPVVAACAAIGPTVTALREIITMVPDRSARQRAEERKDDLERQVSETSERLDRLDARRRIRRLTEQIRSGRYAPYRGLLASVHEDLRRLSEDMQEAVEEWEALGHEGSPPVERIILYVDDIDRCPPRTVVEVLSAMHLLLALPLFVVVVAVDPRWLRRSVEQYHSELFSISGSESRPLDYLDKVFQVTFALRPMGADADALITELLRPAMRVQRSENPPVAGDSGESITEPTAKPTEVPPGEPKTAVPQGEQPVADPEPNWLDPEPDWLRLRDPEWRFVLRLRPVLATPRAVKKLVNLYRLVRIGIADKELDEFLGSNGAGPYQAVLLLLAVVVAAPASARRLLSALLAESTNGDIVDLLRQDDDAQRLAELIKNIREDTEVHGDLSTYRQWAGTIARFSFETYDLVTDRSGNRHDSSWPC